MNKEKEAVLMKEFPSFFVDMYGDMRVTCMAWGCTCGDGWYDIIYNMCKELKQLQDDGKLSKHFKFSQIKEKFGTLRVYVEGCNEKAYKVIDKAEQESGEVCETCGSREDVITEAQAGFYWITTTCAKCRAEAKARLEARSKAC